jgi:hypothetical protein
MVGGEDDLPPLPYLTTGCCIYASWIKPANSKNPPYPQTFQLNLPRPNNGKTGS